MAVTDVIKIVGARSNNLKGVSCEIPRGELTVVTGISGSGKSTLAFETLYAEGQRRYMESLSTYARQFLQKMARPEVDAIENLPPAIAIEQKNKVKNARSTVGTVTEIYDYLRLLFAKVGQPFCPNCNEPVKADRPSAIQEKLITQHPGESCVIFFKIESGKESLLRGELLREGFRFALVSSQRKAQIEILNIEEEESGEGPWMGVVADRLRIDPDKSARLLESLELAFGKGRTGCGAYFPDRPANSNLLHFHAEPQCPTCGKKIDHLRPAQFSFNSPIGACPKCEGFGRIIDLDLKRVIPDEGRSIRDGLVDPFTKPAYKSSQDDLLKACRRLKIPVNTPWNKLTQEQRTFVVEGGKFNRRKDSWYGINGFFSWLEGKRYKTHVRIFLARYRGFSICPTCRGERLRQESLSVLVGGKNINQVCALAVIDLLAWLKNMEVSQEGKQLLGPVLKEIENRLLFLRDVGLGYLNLARQARTLSGGESQRIALASALGTALTETLYVLDEPSIGLHPRDHERLLKILLSLRNLGNTVVVVEHEPEMIAHADHIIDLGPEAGREGGKIIFAGDFANLLQNRHSHTAEFFRMGGIDCKSASQRRRPKKWLRIRGAKIHNLKGLSINLPLELFSAVTGVSGAGKSSLFYNIIYAGYQRSRGEQLDFDLGEFAAYEGLEHFENIILMDQSGLGRSLRSNTATYIGIYSAIRELFAATRAAKRNRLKAGHFSFNVVGGRCEACQGAGVVVLDMHFLEDVQVPCEACGGLRFTPRVMAVEYRQKNIMDVLSMTVSEAMSFFADQREVVRKLDILLKVGLDYLTLGQATSNLSGGEAQRLKLALHLIEDGPGKNLFLFDEPTTGLHPYDISKLIRCYEELIERGHTVSVIEHNLEMISQADYLLDLGPEGGDGGGRLVAEGTPEELMGESASYTGWYLRQYCERHKHGFATAEGPSPKAHH